MYPSRLRRKALALVAFTPLLGAALAACSGIENTDDLFGGGGSNAGAGGATTTASGDATTGGDTTTAASTGSVTTTAATTSSTGGATTTTSSTGSAASTSTGMEMPEDCLDGIDNDGNGLVDCADPACQAGFKCVEDDPPGWKGHFYVTETALPAPAAPACPPDLKATTEFEGPAGAAQCTACSCGALAGATCAPPQLTCWSGSANCGGASKDWTASLTDGACHKPTNLLNGANQLSCELTSPATVASPGACPPSPVDFPNKQLWQQRLDACGIAKPGAGCAANHVCVPKGSGDPAESLCVRQDGVNPCPMGWAKSIQAYGDGSDTRGCTACTCGDGAKCGDANYTIYDLDQCATVGQSDNPVVIGSNACADASVLLDQGSWSVQAKLPKASGSCPPAGGVATGSVQTAKPATYCCK